MKRGDIYVVEKYGTVGHEQSGRRPAIIVSNDVCNHYSPTVEIVYLTTQPKTDLPTHVHIESSSVPSTVLCEQVTTIDTSRCLTYIGHCTDEEMRAIDTAIAVSLGLPVPQAPAEVSPVAEFILKQLSEERAFCRKQYEELLEAFVKGV